MLRIDISSDLERLRGHNDQVAFTELRRIPLGRDPVNRVEDPLANPFGFPFAGAASEEKEVGAVGREHRLKTPEDGSRRRGSVGEHDARPAGAGASGEQIPGRLRQAQTWLTPGHQDFHRLRGIQSPPDRWMRPVPGVQVEPVTRTRIAGRGESHDLWPQTSWTENLLRPRRAFREGGDKPHQVACQVRLVDEH